MKNLLFLLLFIGSNLANAQNLTSTSYLFKANQWLQMKDYANAAEAFAKGFQLNGGMAIPKDRYNAAVAFAHLHNADTVIHYINRLAIRIKYDDIEKIEQEEAFRFLDNNEKWMEVCAQIKKNGEKYNRSVMKILEKCYINDQKVHNCDSNVDTRIVDSLNLLVLLKFLWTMDFFFTFVEKLSIDRKRILYQFNKSTEFDCRFSCL